MTSLTARTRVLALAAAVLLLSWPLAARQTFRAGTDAVVLSITVTDAENRLVAGLTRNDFQVLEDGVPQNVANFSRNAQTIALALLLDTSTSMGPTMAVAQEAAAGLVHRLGDSDVATVIHFDSRAEILQPFTSDHEALDQAIHRTVAMGTTALYDAVSTALTEFHAVNAQSGDRVRRQVIVVLSDGEDTSSRVTYEQILERCKRSEVGVYAIGLKSKPARPMLGFNQADFVFRTLTQETGGRAFFADDVDQLAGVYQQIADELANEYTMDYTSTNLKRDGAWRRILVKTNRPGTTARAKAGYFGPKVGTERSDQ